MVSGQSSWSKTPSRKEKGGDCQCIMPRTRRQPFGAVDAKASVQDWRSKDLRLSKVAQKAMPISLLIEGEGVSETRFLSDHSLSRDTYNPHPT